MRLISMVLALVTSGASSHYTHEVLPTPMAASLDLLILIVVYIAVRRSIRAYLGE
jgi:hypothetical protein